MALLALSGPLVSNHVAAAYKAHGAPPSLRVVGDPVYGGQFARLFWERRR